MNCRNFYGVVTTGELFFLFFFQRESYSEGHAQFHMQEWAKMVETFEESLHQFYPALDDCRALCLGPMKFQENLEFPQVKQVSIQGGQLGFPLLLTFPLKNLNNNYNNN